jgi:hypothetical protein
MSATTEKEKITDEMVRAGVREFYKHDRRFDDPGETVERIWNAMVDAKNEEPA